MVTGICCPLDGTLRSPVVNRYRNKTEFTVGLDVEEQPAVGFLLGAFKEGFTAVADASTCPHLSLTSIGRVTRA